MMIVYGLKTCDSCRKALKSLPGAEFRDVQDGLPEAVARAAAAQFGDRLVNRQSATWRGLDETERARDPLDLVAAHPKVMKRPLIDADGVLHLGWGRDVRQSLAVE